MCLLFFIINDAPSPNGYRLILLNGRDEFWNRPTKTAGFWGPQNSCISSLDQEPEREGGTWLGASKTGKVGCLLNIFGQLRPDKKGRGFLVSNYLAGNEEALSYLQTLDAEKSEYNGFNLILLETGKDRNQAVCLTNASNSSKDQRLFHLPTGEFHAFGNSPYDLPWQKVRLGKERFARIVNQHSSVESKDVLVEELFAMLADRKPNLPDPVLQGTCSELKESQDNVAARSAMCVWAPAVSYGSRTMTVILVDAEGNCDYVERNLVIPVDVQCPKYATQRHNFHVEGR